MAENTGRILDRLAEVGVRGTFFTLGWVAERQPALIRRIVADGHELASHGHGHAPVDRLDEAAFRADVARARAALEDAGGVAGRRLPGADLLDRAAHALGPPRAGRDRPSLQLERLPRPPRPLRRPRRPALRPFGGTGPVGNPDDHAAGARAQLAGLGRRLLPPAALRRRSAWLLRRALREDGRPAVFYTHPWELDPGQPRIAGLSRRSAFRHYLNLGATEGRLRRLLRDFRWDRMDVAFAELLGA